MVGVELFVGGWFVSPVIKSVLDKANKYLSGNYELHNDTKGMVDELINTLLVCQATVTEAEKGAIINNPALVDWLRRLKETVYDAEDVLDNTEAKSIKEKVQRKNKVSKYASTSLSAVINMFSPDAINKSLKTVVDKLKNLSTDIPKILELVNMNNNNESHTHQATNPRETISQPLEEVGLFGRQDELNLILEIILGSQSKSILENVLGSQSKSFFEKTLGSQSKSSKNGEQDDNYHGIFVIPIVGIGGVGKTALAQAVYNNSEVKETFEKRAWISVNNEHDLLLVMRKIFDSLQNYPHVDVTNKSEEYIRQRLSWIIEGVKFLIVLDDMFESHWDFFHKIHKILSAGVPGSVVLITTQNQKFANRVVANTVGAVGPIALSALDSGKFLELFEHFAFGNVVMSKAKRIILKSIGKKMAAKLHGLPLAAKIIGNILNSDLDEHRWRDISKSDWWDIPEGQSKILPSVGLGFEQLNHSLQQCFAYCSLFPRNSLIEKDRLVHMWIAQNFIQSNVVGAKTLENIGRQWFDELVEKSFFQHAWDKNGYVMHELMHDLAVFVSSSECFYLGEGSDEIPLGVRHLSVDTNNLQVIKGIQNHKYLRSFLSFQCSQVKGMYSAINDTLSNLNSIRVLDLSYILMKKENKPPTAIWNLQHLRFLDLSSTGITDLTHSCINLYHLQALYIRKCNFKELPKGIKKLINLRHLCGDEETIAQISGIGQLTNLQELDVFVVKREKGHRITELKNLREIRGTLSIKNFQNIKNKYEAKLANLSNKKHLDSIRIIGNHANYWIPSNEDEEVLQELQPHKDIKDLRIERYGGLNFPNYWIIQIGDHFPNLNTLCLASCVHVKVLPPLGELPSLKHLQIEKFDSVKLIDSLLYGKKQTVFPLLEVLVLDSLFKCEVWTDGGAREFFPHLTKLTIENNRILRKAPLNLFSSTLKELEIHLCHSLISLETSIPSLFSLTRLKLCSSSTSIFLDPLNMPLLEDLNLMYCSELKIKGDLPSLTHLKRLYLVGCPKLFSRYSTRDQQKGKDLEVHQDAGLRSLTHIEADYSLFNHEYYHILGSLPSLRILKFSYITQFTNDQILWVQELTALEEIQFSSCEFEHLPTSLTVISSLKKMKLISCTKLESFLDSMPPNLHELTLEFCSRNLVQLCDQYQQFRSSIPVIHVDDTTTRKKIHDINYLRPIAIHKPNPDMIGKQACASCNKTFEQSDFVLSNRWY